MCFTLHHEQSATGMLELESSTKRAKRDLNQQTTRLGKNSFITDASAAATESRKQSQAPFDKERAICGFMRMFLFPFSSVSWWTSVERCKFAFGIRCLWSAASVSSFEIRRVITLQGHKERNISRFNSTILCTPRSQDFSKIDNKN